MTKIYVEILSRTPVFSGISPDELEKLLDNTLFRIRKLGRDEYAAFAGDACTALMIVLGGSVRGEMTDYSGKVIKIEDIGVSRPIAPAFLFGRQNTYPVDIIANEPSALFVLPRESLIKLLQENTKILTNFLNAISGRAQFLSDKIRFLSFRTIKGKIASYLLSISGKERNPIIMPMNQTQLAGFFGVTRPSLARAFSELEKEGVLYAYKKEVNIVNRDKLSGYLK